MKKTTLKEWGRQLPIGLNPGESKFVRDFEFREFLFNVEREVSDAIQKANANSVSANATLVLSKLLTKLQGHPCDPANPEATQALLARCYVADVMYMWLWARYESMGNEFQMPFICAFCGNVEEPIPTFDIGAIDVNVPDNPTELEAEFKFSQPYRIRGKDTKLFKVRPPSWSVFIGTSQANWNYKSRLFQASIFASDTEEGGLTITEVELDAMKRKDYKGLEKAIDKIAAGPMLALDIDCKKCKKTNKRMLDWEYETFFA